jgi:hypothetical protein
LKDGSGQALTHQRFVIELPDGGEVSGMTGADGTVELGIDLEGSGKIRFLDLKDVKSS